MAEKVADVLDLVLDHGRSLQGQTPGDDSNVLRETHGPQHLWPEHAAVADLRPFAQLRVISKDLHGWLCVRIVGRLEAQLSDADLLEKGLDSADKVT